MTLQSSELGAKRSCHTFVLGSCKVERVLVGDGPRGGVVGHSRMDEALFHIAERYSLHGGLLRRFLAIPNELQVTKVGRGSVAGGGKGPRQRSSGTQSRGAASPRTGTVTDVREWDR